MVTIKIEKLMKGHTGYSELCRSGGRGKDDCRDDGDRPDVARKISESYN